MVVCPECGGEMKFDRKQYLYVCTNCGLALTRSELEKTREEFLKQIYGDSKDKENYKKEYLKWWLSKKE